MAAEFNLGILPANSTPVIASNFVGSSDTRDTFSFSLANSGNINLALTGMSSDADVRLFRDFNGNGIVDAGDTQIGSSTRGGNSDDTINIANQAAGNYVVQVDQLSGDTKYDLRVSTTAFPSASNLLPTETEVGVLTGTRTFTGQVSNNTTAANNDSPGDTSDVYHFVLNAAGNHTFTIAGLSGDADLRLIQDTNSNLVVDAGEAIATSANAGTTSDQITRFLNPGEYFVQVYSFAGIPNDSSQINYTLTMT